MSFERNRNHVNDSHRFAIFFPWLPFRHQIDDAQRLGIAFFIKASHKFYVCYAAVNVDDELNVAFALDAFLHRRLRILDVFRDESQHLGCSARKLRHLFDNPIN